MMASRFRAVYWVGICIVPALGCYLVSQTVAAERAELTRVERRIEATRRDIRQLQTEAGTLARLAQIERWNVDAFALSAPRARQFMRDDLQLASLNLPAPVPVEASAPRVIMAKAATPMRAPQVVRVVAEAPAAADAPVFRQATFVRTREAAPPAVRPMSYAPTLGDGFAANLGRLASAERGGKR